MYTAANILIEHPLTELQVQIVLTRKLISPTDRNRRAS